MNVGGSPQRVALREAGPLLVGVLAGGLALLTAPRHAAQPFYSAAAPVIPLLLLALGMEARVLGVAQAVRPDSRRSRASLGAIRLPVARLLRAGNAIWVVLFLSTGEFHALSVLASGDYGRESPKIEFAAVAFALAVIATLALRPAEPS